ncbi:MAG: transporter substrate-binding domain-containing protein [Phycisphaerales bacterium]|nr:transporter substrate-binding domain-containing protein [Phycisphaerales bacterium]
MPRFLILLVVSVASFLQMPATAVADDSLHVKVGVILEPPFVAKTDGTYNGLSIDLWEMIARDLGWTWTYSVHDLPELLKLVEAGELDVAVGPVAQDTKRERVMDFTPTYINSGLAIASRRKPVRTVIDVISHLGDSAFLQLTLSLVVICLIFGLLMWWMERRRNQDHFGGQMVHGFGSGVWWSMVTMSTVGYGDKAPRTMGGRVVGIIWIFLSIILLSAFTGTIASSLTMGRMGSKVSVVGDLRQMVVGVVDQSEANDWLKKSHVAVHKFNSIESGLQAVVDRDIDVFVGDRSALVWQLGQWKHAAKVVVEGNLHPERLAFAIPTASPHAEALNVAMVKVLDSQDWLAIRTEYGEQQQLLNTLLVGDNLK